MSAGTDSGDVSAGSDGGDVNTGANAGDASAGTDAGDVNAGTGGGNDNASGASGGDGLSVDTGAVPGTLRVTAFTDSLGARVIPSGQDRPDDVDVRLTPVAYTIAFKRLVLKNVDRATQAVSGEIEIFNAAAVENALVVDLLNSSAADVLNVESLPAGTYNQVDIEVFYLDMTIPTLYPAKTSHDIPYRMVFENMGVLQQRDFLLQLDPAWMEPASALESLVTATGWYWMDMGDPDSVTPVEGAAAHPTYHVLDLFANDAFWSAEHKVLEGGRIEPSLVYDPAVGGMVTINFDVTGAFDFKDYHDATMAPDGQWEIRQDAGIHPFPPNFACVPEAPAASK